MALFIGLEENGMGKSLNDKEKMNNSSYDEAEQAKQIMEKMIKLSKPSALMRIFYCILALGVIAIIAYNYKYLLWVRIAFVISGAVILAVIWTSYVISMRKYGRFKTETMNEINNSISDVGSLEYASIKGEDEEAEEIIEDLHNIAKPSIIIRIFYCAAAAFCIVTVAWDYMHLTWVRIASVLAAVLSFALIWIGYAVSLRKYRCSMNEQREELIESPNNCASIPASAYSEGLVGKSLDGDAMHKHRKPSSLMRRHHWLLAAYLIGTICLCLAIVLRLVR